MADNSTGFVRACRLDEIASDKCHLVHVADHAVALVRTGGQVYAVDNRCPHMGFPLHKGSVDNGILTCHWHYARFDLASGGTFDPFADDVRAFPVEIRDGDVWIDVTPRGDEVEHQRERLAEGLEQNIRLVVAKSVIALLERGGAGDPFRTGLLFGVTRRRDGWAPGLTMLTCFMNLLGHLDPEDRARALYHGLSAVGADCAGMAPRVAIKPLPDSSADTPTLKTWFRRFVEVRDADGAERCIVTAIRQGAAPREVADMLFAAATDHRYINVGHVLDFTNKALEALDIVGWEHAEVVVPSLIRGYAAAGRSEESNSWRHPVDLIDLLREAFEELPAAVHAGASGNGAWHRSAEMVEALLGDCPHTIISALMTALRAGASPEQLAQTVAYAAALRIARFHTANEFGDWNTVLHTFTFANAVHQGMRRAPSVELLRGVFDAAMSVYLDRFLNTPPARLPSPGKAKSALPAEALRAELLDLLDRQQQVDPAGAFLAEQWEDAAASADVLAAIGKALLREDRDFHTIQCVEAACRQLHLTEDDEARRNILVAAVRYLAAHCPSNRAQGQTYQIAVRLHRGERIFEDA